MTRLSQKTKLGDTTKKTYFLLWKSRMKLDNSDNKDNVTENNRYN